MHESILVNLMAFYGIFLISCGITAVTFIGPKAKTALISGGTSGLISLLISYLIFKNIPGAHIAGIILPLALFIVFSWRSTKTLFTLLDMVADGNSEVKAKAIAFLIIGLMAVVSIVVVLWQVAFLNL